MNSATKPAVGMRPEIAPFVFFGLVVGVGLSLVSAGAFVLGGGYREAGEAAVLVKVVAAFLVSGPLAGLTAGLLYPLARWRIGAAVIGGLAMIPIVAALSVFTDGGIDWRSLDDILVPALIVGCPVGLFLIPAQPSRGTRIRGDDPDEKGPST